ncbi:odorant receptor 13a-like isoform X2 [Megalopta genalis]|uniref:odorant receptor 13a-like isoform X2 n=1 Tax=Megalopta genalis TaxID=115081 RepID=UPI003FD28813
MRAEETNDFSLTVTSFYLKLTGLWSAVNPTEERERRKAFSVTIVVMLIGLFIEVRDFYHSISTSFEDTIFALCNIVTVLIVLCKTCVLYIKKSQFSELLVYSEKHFWHTNYDACETVLIKECKRLCIIITCLFNLFAQSISFSYILEPLVDYFDKNVSVRKLPFNMYMDLLLKPYFYELTFLIQTVSLAAYGIGYLCVDNIMYITNYHAAAQFRILQYRISNITSLINIKKRSAASESVPNCTADRCYTKFKECIRQHQKLLAYYRKVDELFAIIVFEEILLFSIMLCLDGYLMLLGNSSPYRRAVFTIHLAGCVSELLMFTYSCNCVLQESTQVAESFYSIQWPVLPMNNSGKMLRTDMRLILMRSRVPCCLTAGGFFTVSLETYTKVLSTAVSYFTLLREY